MHVFQQIRKEILEEGLDIDSINKNPLNQFEAWMLQAKNSEIRYPTTMSLATVDNNGKPVQRLVMLRSFDEKGFVFFSSLGTKKTEHMEGNPNVSLIFPWHMLERQVHITGKAEQLSKLELIKYFSKNPTGAKISSWLSGQSSPVSHRQILESKIAEIKEHFSKGTISMPPFFGGFRIVPDHYEFWQSGKDKVNDRFFYTKNKNQWEITRMTP